LRKTTRKPEEGSSKQLGTRGEGLVQSKISQPKLQKGNHVVIVIDGMEGLPRGGLETGDPWEQSRTKKEKVVLRGAVKD